MILASPANASLAPMTALQAGAAAADLSGQLQSDQVRLIHRSGWLKMLAPKAVGGQELDLPEVVRREEALCEIDGSCGWVVTLCAGAGWFAGFLPPALARQIMDTPDVCLAGSGAPTGHAERDGEGWRLSGRWSHASGSQFATHFTLNAQLRDQGAPMLDAQGRPRICAFVVPAAQVQIEHGSWHSIGLRATTSCAFSLQGVHVRADHAFVIDPAHATAAGPLYRFPFEALAFVTLSACVLGMARHFLSLAQPLIARKIPSLDAPAASAQTLWQSGHDALQAARTAFYAELDSAWQHFVHDAVLDRQQEQGLIDRSRALARLARETVDALYPGCGLQAADPRTEINRVWRDLHTASQHAIWMR